MLPPNPKLNLSRTFFFWPPLTEFDFNALQICLKFSICWPVKAWYFDGNLEIDAHVRSNLFYLICIRLMISSRAGKKSDIFIRKRPIFFYHACAICKELPSNIRSMYSSMVNEVLHMNSAREV